MAKKEADPQVLEEPEVSDTEGDEENPWMRGLWMVILAILFGIGETILLVCAIIQFIWILTQKEKNQPIADFGADLGDWLAKVARYQTATSDDRPFPFEKWGGA